MNFKEELRQLTEEAQITKIKEGKHWRDHHFNMVKNRVITEAKNGFHTCYAVHLSEEEEAWLMNQGLTVTKVHMCDCVHGNGWFIDWYTEEELWETAEEFLNDEDKEKESSNNNIPQISYDEDNQLRDDK
jgi:hypothetical protein